MNPFKTLRNSFKKKAIDPTLGGINLGNAAWQTLGGSMSFDHYKRNDLENSYAPIRVIVNNFAKIEPYTIDKTGKSVASNVLDRLYTPNTSLSAYDFREALAVMSLVHNKVHIRVVHNGDEITADSITGFLFLENEVEAVVGGKRQYRMPSGKVFTDDEVITLLNINPYDIDAGFSPATAARRWTKLDDYIADYQAGLFENGAVPAGQMIVTAKTKQDYNDIVDKLVERHKGSGKNGNITYAHKPTDDTGKSLNSQIEWVPFSTPNNHMALGDLFSEVNKKIDSTYGVPASLRGVNDNNTYASVKVDQKILIENVIEPLVMKVWSKFTHELNRITGGLGVAITADVEVPEIADEQLVKAQAKQAEMSIINMMAINGFTIDSVVDAFELSQNYKKLAMGKKPVVVEDKPEVVDLEDIKDTPEQPVDNSTPTVKSKQIKGVDKELYEYQYAKLVKEHMVRQVEKAIQELPEAMKSKAFGDTTYEEDEQFVKDVIKLMTPLISVYGQEATNQGIKLILEGGFTADNISVFAMTEAEKTAYLKYVQKVARGYTEYTGEQIRYILARSITEGATQADIANNLREIITGKDNLYRVDRIARTEVHLAEGKSSVMAMQNISDETGYKVYKEWNATGADTCEFCQAMHGTQVEVSENFLNEGDNFSGVDGGILKNDFTNIESANLHPNCECTVVYKVEGF